MSGYTKGPWRSVIDDTGGQWSGWPLCVCPVGDDDRTVVRTGGMWPYEWDAHTSQAEAVANARLIAAAPDLLQALEIIENGCAGVRSVHRFSTARDIARAAIARATGETK